LAPTANNVQPWEFVVVTDPELLRRIAVITEYGKFIADAPVCVVVLSRDTKYYLEDGSAATENILLAARAHGLGSCWVAGDKKPYVTEICRLVAAPRGYKLVSLIPIGYPAESPEKSKRPLSDVLHWEKY
jgi:nitroreductase